MIELVKRKSRAAWKHGRWLARHGWPRRPFYTYGAGFGDQLLLTTVAHESARRTGRPLAVVSGALELFERNPDVGVVVQPWSDAYRLLQWLRYPIRTIRYIDDRGPTQIPPANPGPNHIIDLLLQAAGISGTITRRPYFYLSPEEVNQGRIAKRQITMQTSTMAAKHPMRTKQWHAERFQTVADELRKEATILQIGHPDDPSIVGATDLRGKTTIRELAAILKNSLLHIGLISFPMHLARAVDCRAVIVFGGREGPEQSGYSANENLFTQLECSRCWLYNGCPNNHECMNRITDNAVLAAARRQLERVGEPLPVETGFIPA